MLKLPLPPSSPERTWLLPFWPLLLSTCLNTAPSPDTTGFTFTSRGCQGWAPSPLRVSDCHCGLSFPVPIAWEGHLSPRGKLAAELIPRSARHPWSHSQDALCPLACGRERTHGVLLPFFRRLNSGVGRGAVWVGDGGHSRHGGSPREGVVTSEQPVLILTLGPLPLWASVFASAQWDLLILWRQWPLMGRHSELTKSSTHLQLPPINTSASLSHAPNLFL